ncbi:MAG: NAD(P)H-hydrate dehydratase [Ramlibacter sp.]|nr:NAD(P)H-hydrate dehydratase [Ramlibacter sp.]
MPPLHRITPERAWPLHDRAATQHLEAVVAATLPSHTLMQRAGLAVARLALALAPHGQVFWIACGRGNNGGDGFEAALHLQAWGKQPVLTWLGDEATSPADALASLARARAAGVAFADAPPSEYDLGVDALLGLGFRAAGAGRTAGSSDARLAHWLARLNDGHAPLLNVDLPSGLDADTGNSAHFLIADKPASTGAAGQFPLKNGTRHTLSLLTLKPGLFTADGRDRAGQVWWDDLSSGADKLPPTAWLGLEGSLDGGAARAHGPHASHKGSYGDVAVIGGAPGMTGAALLAGRAALHGGAGRVFVALLDGHGAGVDAQQPELMYREADALDFYALTVVCGCGGGDAVRGVLPRVLSTAARLVLDADALNAIAADSALQTLLAARGRRGAATVLTPHPLEAARLLGSTTAAVQADRLGAAQTLVQRFGSVVVLKGSGTVTAAPDQLPVICAGGNARLATGGTGDVLAGLVGALLAAGMPVREAACSAVARHAGVADRWPDDRTLTAGALASSL